MKLIIDEEYLKKSLLYNLYPQAVDKVIAKATVLSEEDIELLERAVYEFSNTPMFNLMKKIVNKLKE